MRINFIHGGWFLFVNCWWWQQTVFLMGRLNSSTLVAYLVIKIHPILINTIWLPTNLINRIPISTSVSRNYLWKHIICTIWAVSFVAGLLSDVSYPMPTISALQWWFQWQGFGEFDWSVALFFGHYHSVTRELQRDLWNVIVLGCA
jgi:hypothetical protein